MALEIESKKVGSAAVISLRGKITLGEASQSLRKSIDDVVEGGCSQVVLNLSGVPFIDSAGLGALTVGYTKTKTAGGMLKLAEAQPRVEDALEMTRLTRMFPLYKSEQLAVESFSAPDTAAPPR